MYLSKIIIRLLFYNISLRNSAGYFCVSQFWFCSLSHYVDVTCLVRYFCEHIQKVANKLVRMSCLDI